MSNLKPEDVISKVILRLSAGIEPETTFEESEELVKMLTDNDLEFRLLIINPETAVQVQMELTGLEGAEIS